MKVSKRHSILAAVLVFVTFVFGVVYVSVRQTWRLGANEPQTSMVQDVVRELNNGRRPDDLFTEKLDVAVNMAPFIIVYDKYGNPVAGSGYLDGTWPKVPVGVLAASKEGRVNKVIWQPNDRVRIASVSQEADNFYVLGGRSLMVIERKITNFTRWLVVAWLTTLALLIALCKLWEKKPKKLAPKDHEPSAQAD
jgi:hypothetical protein